MIESEQNCSGKTDYESVVVTSETGFLGLHTCQYFPEQAWYVTALDLKYFDKENDTDSNETAHEGPYVSGEELRKQGWKLQYSNQEALIGTYHWYIEHSEESEDPEGDHRMAWGRGHFKSRNSDLNNSYYI